MGMGPRSGRAAGHCGGFDAPGYANLGLGRGRGWGLGRGGGGRGRGFGRRWRGFAFAGLPDWIRWGGRAPDVEMDRQVLKGRAEALRAQLQAIENRLAESDEKLEEPE
jgi:Family of unknown function (DUF5320)